MPTARRRAPDSAVVWSAIADPAEVAEAAAAIAEPGAALRTKTPEQTIARVTPYLPDYGITRVAHLTRLDRVGIPVHTAHKPAGKSLSNGSGKGSTPLASKVGAIMEAIEQTYWEDSNIERVVTSQADLATVGVAHVDPRDVPMNRGNLYNERLAIEWTAMVDVATGEQVLAPADIVGLPWRTGSRRVALTHMCSSNGLASGSNVIEAVLSGLTEVMERDALAMKIARTGAHFPQQSLSHDSLEASYGDVFSELRVKIDAAELNFSVYDATTELGLPTFKCYLIDPTMGGAGTFGGYGASLDPAVALTRAVTEAAQARCLIIAGARDDQFRCGRDASQLASRQHQFAQPPATGEPKGHPDRSSGSLAGDVELLVAQLAANGMPQVLVHRYTQPGDPVQVVRVLVPRLEGYMFANYQPGPRALAAMAESQALSA